MDDLERADAADNLQISYIGDMYKINVCIQSNIELDVDITSELYISCIASLHVAIDQLQT